MEVATVSAKDANASLSKKSPMPRKSLRKAMLSPYSSIRPICPDSSEIEEIMRRILICAKRKNYTIPWSEFKEMSEEERKRAKEERRSKNVNKSIRNQLVCGINEVFSAIEKHNLSSAVVCEDLAPAFLMKFLLDLATIHNVPILILPTLRKITLETLGFPCSSLGLKRNTASEDSFFYPLHQKIVEIVKEFEVPENRILCQCPLKVREEFRGNSSTSDDQVLKLAEKDAGNVTMTNSGWPCMNPNRKSYWKLTKEKIRKGKGDKETGNKSGMAISSVTGDDSMELDKGKGNSKTLAAGTSKSKGTFLCSNRKDPEAHPYMRTFLMTSQPQKIKRKKCFSSGESVIVSKDGKQAKKVKKQNISTEGVRKISDAESVQEVATTQHKAQDFIYVIRSGKERKHLWDHYKPLQLTDD